MQKINSKPVIAIYTQRYLNKSMTFVYRQLLSVSEEFEIIVITSNEINNRDTFPFEKIFSKKITPLGRLYRLYKKLTGHFAVLSPMQKKYFYNVLRTNNVKLIHAHFGPSGIEICPLAKKLGIPLVVTFHGYDASSLLTNRNYIRDLKTLLIYSYSLAVSRFIYDKLINLGADRDKIEVYHCGVNLENFHFVRRSPISLKLKQKEEIIFLQISNFHEKKGHEFTLKAFNNLLKKYDNCKLILGGDGPLFKKIKTLCDNLEIANKVQLLGSVNHNEVFALMNSSDIFVHHSITTKRGDEEGIPTVIMEAMATGLPVISTYHAGIPELIDNNVNGFLVKERDIEGFTNAMIKAIESNKNIADIARLKIEKDFNNKILGPMLNQLYKRIISEKQ